MEAHEVNFDKSEDFIAANITRLSPFFAQQFSCCVNSVNSLHVPDPTLHLIHTPVFIRPRNCSFLVWVFFLWSLHALLVFHLEQVRRCSLLFLSYGFVKNSELGKTGNLGSLWPTKGFFSPITHRGGFAGTLRRREYKALGIVDSLISLLCICHVFNKEKKIA